MDEHQKKLIDYINGQLQRGVDRDIIMKGLVGVGWPKERIDEAFRSIGNSAPQFVPKSAESEISSVSDSKYKGIGGWMILFSIILCLYIYRQFFVFYDRILFFLSYFGGTLPAKEIDRIPAYAVSLVILTLFLSFAIYILYLLFNKREKFSKHFLIFLGVVVAGNLISNLLNFFIGVRLIEIIGSIAAGILIPFIAWRYIVSSKRVKATFVGTPKRNLWWIPLALTLAIAATAPYLILFVGVTHTLNSASDAQRVSDLQSLKKVLGDYYAQHKSYPTSLSAVLNEPNPEISRIPQDPNGVPYSYTSDGSTYELCANTEGDSIGNLTFTNRRYCMTSEAEKITSLIPPELVVYLSDYYSGHQRFPETLADLKNSPTNIDVTGIKNLQYDVLDGGKSYQFSTKDPSGKTLCYGPDDFFDVPCK